MKWLQQLLRRCLRPAATVVAVVTLTSVLATAGVGLSAQPVAAYGPHRAPSCVAAQGLAPCFPGDTQSVYSTAAWICAGQGGNIFDGFNYAGFTGYTATDCMNYDLAVNQQGTLQGHQHMIELYKVYRLDVYFWGSFHDMVDWFDAAYAGWVSIFLPVAGDTFCALVGAAFTPATPPGQIAMAIACGEAVRNVNTWIGFGG